MIAIVAVAAIALVVGARKRRTAMLSDALVAELMQRLAAMFATERAELEKRWAGGHQVSTEDLRQGLRRYRSFFERLLAA